MVQNKYFHLIESHKLETLLLSNPHNGEYGLGIPYVPVAVTVSS